MLLSEIDQPIQAFSVAKKINEAAAVPMVIEGQNVGLQLSIGVSIYPETPASRHQKPSDRIRKPG